MSARQRHSRVTTSDGWTTISNSSARKKKGSSAKNAAHSALLAHKSDLGNAEKGGKEKEAAYGDPFDEKELAKVKARLEKQIDGFNSSSGYVGLKSVLDEEKLTGVNNVLILALGSISESFKPGPGYQLAAALGIIEALKGEGDSKTRSPEVDGGDTADGTVLESQEKKDQDGISTSKEERRSQDQITILSYDPIYTAIDINLLKLHGITHVPASQIPSDVGWYKNSVVYMPHASVWLNHKYFMLRPKVWIGNSFDIYEIAVSGDDENGRNGSEVAILLKEVDEVVKAENYVKIMWPEEGWGGGVMFNNLAIYVRKGDSGGGEGNGLIKGMENISLS